MKGFLEQRAFDLETLESTIYTKSWLGHPIFGVMSGESIRIFRVFHVTFSYSAKIDSKSQQVSGCDHLIP